MNSVLHVFIAISHLRDFSCMLLYPKCKWSQIHCKMPIFVHFIPANLFTFRPSVIGWELRGFKQWK